MTTINTSKDLLSFIVGQSQSGNKNWFGFAQQRIVGINTAYEMAIKHGDKMTPEEIVEYVVNLNNCIFQKLIKASE
jgi:hypothetical protein